MRATGTMFRAGDFLLEREALLVHFSTPMTRHESVLFPEDLRTAMTLTGVALSFSTILRNDVGPWQSGMNPERANAGGSVGLIVDIPDDKSVLTVGPSDDGTFYDPSSGKWISGGSPPTAEACARSIDEREGSNEWFLRDWTPVGIFVFLPIRVRKAFTVGPYTVYDEDDMELGTVLSEFPDQRVFSLHQKRFVEFNRATATWSQVEYSAIILR